jgi:hypothetical protein
MITFVAAAMCSAKTRMRKVSSPPFIRLHHGFKRPNSIKVFRVIDHKVLPYRIRDVLGARESISDFLAE